jgi:hypothetical protein
LFFGGVSAMKFKNQTLLMLSLLAFFTACQSNEIVKAPVPELPAVKSETTPSHTSIEISYVRGQNHHRFIAQNKENAVIAKSFIDNQLLKETSIDMNQYEDLVKRTSDLIVNVQHRGAVPDGAPCRTPFSVSLRTQTAIQEVNGCRSTDDGASLGKLIRDAEFLVFSHNKN